MLYQHVPSASWCPRITSRLASQMLEAWDSMAVRLPVLNNNVCAERYCYSYSFCSQAHEAGPGLG